MDNKFGRTSALVIETRETGGQTELDHLSFTAPFKVAKSFKDARSSGLNIIIMNASAGVMEGDMYAIDVKVGPRSKLTLTNQSYNKIHKMKEGKATQHAHLAVGKGATLSYLPEPTIPFEHANFETHLQIHLEEDASLTAWDIVSCGRCKSGEQFKFKNYLSRTEIFDSGRYVYVDQCRFAPDKMPLAGIGYFEGYSHFGSMMLWGQDNQGMCPGEQDIHSRLARVLDLESQVEHGSQVELGWTQVHTKGIVVRCLGNGAERIKRVFKTISGMI
jgi:urease accessory protein